MKNLASSDIESGKPQSKNPTFQTQDYLNDTNMMRSKLKDDIKKEALKKEQQKFK